MGAKLGIAPGDEVYCIERLRYIGKDPLVLITSYLPKGEGGRPLQRKMLQIPFTLP